MGTWHADLSFNSAHRGVTIRGAWRSEIRGRGRSPDPTSRFTAGASEMRGRGRSPHPHLSLHGRGVRDVGARALPTPPPLASRQGLRGSRQERPDTQMLNRQSVVTAHYYLKREIWEPQVFLFCFCVWKGSLRSTSTTCAKPRRGRARHDGMRWGRAGGQRGRSGGAAWRGWVMEVHGDSGWRSERRAA